MVRGPDRDVTRQDVMDAMVAQGQPREPFTSSDLASHLPVSKDTVYNRLRELKELDRVDTKKVGARARVWWSIENGAEPPAISLDGFSNRDSQVMRVAIDAARTGTPITSSYVESQTGIDSNIAYKRLDELGERGWLDSKKVGANARVWWLSASPPGQTGETSEQEKPV